MSLALFASSLVRRALPGAASLLALAAFTAPAAHAQANLTFTGGSGTPLTITLAAPVTYTVTTTGQLAPFFLFDAVGTYRASGYATTSTSTYTINGGAPQTLDALGTGNQVGDVTGDDFYVSSAIGTILSPGDVVVLSSGTITTTTNFTGAPPASGAFTTFLIEGFNGTRISGNGTSAAPTAAAPEPGSIALLLTAGVPVVGLVRRRKGSDKAVC